MHQLEVSMKGFWLQTVGLCMALLMCNFVMLQHDILDINDIFRDLGTMVHEQGDMIGIVL